MVRNSWLGFTTSHEEEDENEHEAGRPSQGRAGGAAGHLAKGFIPSLADAAGLIWIEHELAQKGLDPKRRAALEALRQKGLDGSLTQVELNNFRKQGRSAAAALKAYLSALRQIRRRGEDLASVPAEVLSHLDSAIEILANHRPLSLARFEKMPTLRAGGYRIFKS